MATTLGFRRFLATILAAAGLAAGHTAKAGGNWMPLLPDQDFTPQANGMKPLK